jgi:hypothetical protein
MVSVESGIQVTNVNVMTSDDGGHTNEQIAELAMDKILRVSDSAPPAIKDQANAFKENIRSVVLHYIELARREERATIARKMAKAGQNEMADLVRRL